MKTGHILEIVFMILAIVGFSGCSSMQELNRERLNHPSADLSASPTPSPRLPLTSLGSIRQKSAQSGCNVCAH